MPKTTFAALAPHDKTVLKHILTGGSVIDWRKLFFDSEEAVRQFLKVNEFDNSREKDLQRLSNIHSEAVGYLQRELRYDLAEELLHPKSIAGIFVASSGEDLKLRKQACALLKAMNIINHIDGRELLYNCPISLRDLFSLVEDKVERTLAPLRRDALLLKYQGGRKPKESLITKLLGKRETIAAQIYDRVRYRIVTRTREDIVKVILHLFRHALPFNYLIPEISVNQLISFGSKDKFGAIAKGLKNRFPFPMPAMEYSGKTYRVCKFVVDIPVRMDNFLSTSAGPAFRDSLGTISFVLVEFQIVDEETEQKNNSGKNSHDSYKKRQKKGVIKRLGAM